MFNVNLKLLSDKNIKNHVTYLVAKHLYNSFNKPLNIENIKTIAFSNNEDNLQSFIIKNLDSTNIKKDILDCYYILENNANYLLGTLTEKSFTDLTYNKLIDIMYSVYVYEVAFNTNEFKNYLAYLNSKIEKENIEETINTELVVIVNNILSNRITPLTTN